MGGTLGTLFAPAGHEVVFFGYSRSQQKLKKLARGRGKRTGKHGDGRRT
jgi:predicted dinucleotide-binding enzyme